MGRTIHNAAQGKTKYADDGSDWVPYGIAKIWNNQFPKDALGNQQKWKTTLGFVRCPRWAEVGDETLVVPIFVELCSIPCLDGTKCFIEEIWGEYPDHTRCTVTMDAGQADANGHFVGSNDGMRLYTGSISFNLGDWARAFAALPADQRSNTQTVHGWTGITLKARTILSNGDTLGSVEAVLPLFSVVDVTQPETTIKEEGLCLLGRATQCQAHQIDMGSATIAGATLIAVRDQSFPGVGASEVSYAENVEAYTYGEDPALHAFPPQGQPGSPFSYTVFAGGDDDAVPPVPPVQLTTQPFGGTGNYDVIDFPAILAAPKPDIPAGSIFPPPLAANQNILTLSWVVDTTPVGPFTSARFSSDGVTHPTIPAGISLEVQMITVVTVGPNPVPPSATPLTLYTVPGVVGQTLETARAWIEGAGFRVGDISYNDMASAGHPGWAPGTVWTQRPVVGPQGSPLNTLFDLGTPWTGASPPGGNPQKPALSAPPIGVPPITETPPPSGGAPPVGAATVPNVVGLTQAEAIAAITAANLHPNQSAGTATGVVVSQSPPAGSPVVPTSNVDYVLGAAPAPPAPVVVTTTFATYVKRTTIDGVVQPLQECFKDDQGHETCKAF